MIKDWLVKPLRDQHVKPRSSATFRCQLFKDTPNWKWLKGETELVPSDKVEISKDGITMMLTINNCQPDDVSEYTFAVEDRKYVAKLSLGGARPWRVLAFHPPPMRVNDLFGVLLFRAPGGNLETAGQRGSGRKGRSPL